MLLCSVLTYSIVTLCIVLWCDAKTVSHSDGCWRAVYYGDVFCRDVLYRFVV